ncbi:Putative phage abortive infection protein [Mesonia phycicola]|uniref:Putative phage abortive infection protein n=1 Tax=Mesonia phycicola TaxID=579105 RepID=A0A1M6I0Z5_9FLAO|nr:putative phage abortive infection protein [Mesonia phycicola]SHJ28107.1 Putative phage abortive infection protein [Mesonia phycicola]
MIQSQSKDIKSKKIINWLVGLAIALIVISFLSPWLLTSFSILDLSRTGQIGDTLGGIMNPFIALAGVLVTYLAFYIQYKANQYQREQFDIQLNREKEQFRLELESHNEQFLKSQFENQFYQMLSIHRENVKNLTYHNTLIDLNDFENSTYEKNEIEGIKTFPYLLTEFEYCFNLVKIHFKDLELKEIINEAYGMFWDGITKSDISKHKIFAIAFDQKESLYNSFLNGNSNQLAHYYRQLFQTVKFVVNQSILNYEQKRNYLRILRSQLSNEEQVLLFYNWFSGFGIQWENFNNKYFTDYRMIHNVFPNMLIEEIKLDKIFDLNGTYKKEKGRINDSLFEFQDWKK